jgi:hypothetical protein
MEALANIAIDSLTPFFRNNNGRPTKDLNTMTGLVVHQDMVNLTDGDTLPRLRYDMSFRWALDIQVATDETLYAIIKIYRDENHA